MHDSHLHSTQSEDFTTAMAVKPEPLCRELRSRLLRLDQWLKEVVDVGTPAVCVPAPRAFDDQKSRAVALQRAGYDVLVARMSSRSISSRLRLLLRRHGVTFTPGPTRFSGAAEAADALLDLLKGSPDTPWHQHLSGGACDDLWAQ